MTRPIILLLAIIFSACQICNVVGAPPTPADRPEGAPQVAPMPLHPVIVEPEPEPPATRQAAHLEVAAVPQTGPIFGAPTQPAGPVSPWMELPSGHGAMAGVPNPLPIPVADEEYTWDQIADVVSDYFTISGEQRVRRLGSVWTEGRIETAPQSGATVLEPHRFDSVGSFNRWESTFQTIRRWAIVRVIPDSTGYLVDVEVHKELEDLPRPEFATAGVATFRNDGSLPSRRAEQVSHTQSSPRWIPLGRDPALEERMLADIQIRLGGSATLPVEAIAPQNFGPRNIAPQNFGPQPSAAPWQLPSGWGPPPITEGDCSAPPAYIEIFPDYIESDCSTPPQYFEVLPEGIESDHQLPQ